MGYKEILVVQGINYEEVTKKKGKTSSRRMMSRMQYRDLKRSSQFHHAVDGNIMGYKERFLAQGIDCEATFCSH